MSLASAATFAGCPTAGNQAMDCLRSSSVGELIPRRFTQSTSSHPLGALVSAVNRVPNGAFAPVIDGPGGFLPDLPSRLIASGNFSAVDFVGGHCTGDGKTFASGKPSSFVTDEDIRRIVFSRWPGVSNMTKDKALALYPRPGAPNSPFPTQWDRAWTMAGEIIFTCMFVKTACYIMQPFMYGPN
ncbi:hypothetical protein C0992_005128 [Termitomyces sp. T32_za158]|nr:hypothetical protein C0992_005128 [Termitomyces sp. T32_za158]